MKPATPGKGHYSDTGYQLLGAVIEQIDNRTFAESVRDRSPAHWAWATPSVSASRTLIATARSQR